MKKALQSPSLTGKLKAYSMAAGALGMAAGTAEANVIYTDENPDFAGVIGSQYFLDLNNDGNDDFRIWHNGSSNLYISPLTSQNEVLGSGGSTFAYPFALNSSAIISSGAGGFFNNGFGGGFQSLNYGNCSFGNWCTVTDGFIGLRFQIGANIHYGWVRLDVNQAGSVWTVKDYAYEDIAGTAILAGSMGAPGTASTAGSVTGVDIADNGSAQDLEVSFAAGAQENTINEYRVMVVKSVNAGAFDLVAAQAVIPANYTAILPNGSPSYMQVMALGAMDVDGDAIAQSVPYTVFVMSEADGINATIDNVSSGSPSVTLEIPADTASNLVAADIGDLGGGLDFELAFDGAMNENTLAEYRIMVVKSADVATFDFAAAQAVAPADYTVVATGGGPSYAPTLAANATDVDGDPISNGVPYAAFIMNVADGVNATLDILTGPSNEITLFRSADPALNIGGVDVADFGDSQDLQVTFDAAVDESTVMEYRMMVTKASTTPLFNQTIAEGVPVGDYYAINPVGNSSYTVAFPSGINDATGNPIVSGFTYNVWILSVADGVFANLHTLAGPSADVDLDVQAEAATTVTAADVSDLGDGRDLDVSFDGIANESTISEYRILVVKSANSGTFDQAAADAATDFDPVTPNGSTSYQTTLDANDRDVDGDLIVNGQPYRVFIMTVASGGSTTSNNLSTASNEVTLLGGVGVEENALEDVRISARDGQVTVMTDGSLNGATVEVMDLTGRVVTTGQVNGSRTVLNLEQTSSSVYLLRLQTAEEQTTRKFFMR